ncbi:acetyl-CoA acetyltransferase [Parvularcula lutaonensis]|uniref:Acetyl-CoA acetyltransferase n=1 Tax=Parvularcula lutaonensis TaxID=491923 RepID=A0ABV7MAG1_9PROT|nr:acetyl-CoA acetyltransferase [Parvularcula lutaonensis]GGY37832.1 acetyl-CoA acetyltransferase [Parvularcula lutaonensis]
MAGPVYILGGAQTDFARNWTREGSELFDLFQSCLLDALDGTRIDADEVEVGHVGNFVAELFTGQGMLGGFFAHADPGFAGMPASRHEGACASGSLALMAAMADIESGRYDLACVVGIELMRNVAGHLAADHLGAAAWRGKEAQGATYVWPAMFSDLAEEYDRRYGLDYRHLMGIAEINFANAKRNPLAQTRGWGFTSQSFTADDEANPVIEGWMRRQDCAQVTDGAAVLFLASPERAKAYCDQHGLSLENLPRIDGWGHTTAPMMLEQKLKDSAGSPYVFPWVRKAITDAYDRAGLQGPDDLDLIETHDCFTITEYMAIEHFGLTLPGEGWKAVEDGRIAFGGSLPVNPSGGLIGLGHPVGATGVRMVLDASRQVSGQAGDYQVEGARRAATYNVGGSGTTNCCFIVAAG